MGTEREGRLIFSMAVPIALSMLVQALYNIVDSIFVGQISETALSAISVCFPFQALFAALNVGIGIGMSQLISLSLGRRKEKKAKLAAGQGFFMVLCCTAFFMIFGLFFTQIFFDASGISGTIATVAQEYLRIVTIFSFGLFCESVLERMLMSTGHAKCTMICQITGAALNVAMDPLLIFGCGPIPAMGVKGGAIATVIAQFASAILAWHFHRKDNALLHFSLFHIKPRWRLQRAIFNVGISATVKQGAAAMVLMFLNAILIRFTPVATAVYGVFNRLYVFFLTPTWALQDVLVILVAYNLGIRNRKRICRLFKLSLLSALGIIAIGTLITICIPEPLLKVFGAKEAMLALGRTALPLLACFLPFQVAASTISAMLQGLGEGHAALIAGLIERCFLPLVLMYLAALSENLNLVWSSFTLAEIIGLGVSIWFMHIVFRKKVAALPDLKDLRLDCDCESFYPQIDTDVHK